MKTVDLNKVLEMLINEEQNEAAGLLHEWFVERSKQIHEELMSEDNSLSQDIEDDQEAIESEEFYSEAEGDDDDADAEAEEDEADADLEVGGEELPADMDADMVGGEELPAEDTIADTIEDLEAVMARLKAEFAEITGADEAGEEVEVTENAEVDAIRNKKFSDMTDEEKDTFFDYVPEADSDWDDFQDEIGYNYVENGPSVFVSGNTFWGKRFTVISVGLNPDGTANTQELNKVLQQTPGAEVLTSYPGFGPTTNDEGGDDHDMMSFGFVIKVEDVIGESEVTETEDDFADLEESWTLEPVKDPNLNGGKEIGADGAKVAVNDKSPLPEHDADARVGGKAVEIHSDHHEGHEREAAPEVKARPLLKNQVKKATDGRTKVSKEGDKSAKLNSKDGFGSDSPKSPIGQATDLRGSDFKRK